jgi:hypothetical protein
MHDEEPICTGGGQWPGLRVPATFSRKQARKSSGSVRQSSVDIELFNAHGPLERFVVYALHRDSTTIPQSTDSKVWLEVGEDGIAIREPADAGSMGRLVGAITLNEIAGWNKTDQAFHLFMVGEGIDRLDRSTWRRLGFQTLAGAEIAQACMQVAHEQLELTL